MRATRLIKWIAGLILLPVLAAVLFVAIYGWNWLRAPIERMTLEKTGRELVIAGDLKLHLGWPLPRIRAEAVRFANPSWAKEKQMIVADSVEATLDLPQLLQRNIYLPEVRLSRPVVFLERGSGERRNWLLDLEQQDDEARIRIGRLLLDNGRLGYDDAAAKTSIRADLSTSNDAEPANDPKAANDAKAANNAKAGAGLSFAATGKYKGLSLVAKGSGGPVLALRDEATPYPLTAEIAVGPTSAKLSGTITSLLKISAMDMRLVLRGANLADLYPLLGIAFPQTRAYATEGRIVHSELSWRYEKFSGRIGASDIAGTIQVDTGGRRPSMKGDLVSGLLDFADLGPLIGARPGSVQAARQPDAASAEVVAATPAQERRAQARVLPDMPFKTERWDSVDAEITLKAKTIRRPKQLPIENLDVHLSLRDAVLTLAPLSFGVAGGRLNAVISLDGRKQPIQASAQIQARKMRIAKLFPTLEMRRASIGEVNGEFDLAGSGNTVASMLASSRGKASLVVANGEISRMMMEQVGLHLWEMLVLKVTGDKPVKLRCAVADFSVKGGVMHADALIFDTEVTTILGTGSIDLGQEKLDLTLNQKTKRTSPVALSSPIYVRGSFARPEVELDKGRIAVRGLGAIALGLINPLLALIPLVDAGPGADSDCGQLVREARKSAPAARKKTSPRT